MPCGSPEVLLFSGSGRRASRRGRGCTPGGSSHGGLSLLEQRRQGGNHVDSEALAPVRTPAAHHRVSPTRYVAIMVTDTTTSATRATRAPRRLSAAENAHRPSLVGRTPDVPRRRSVAVECRTGSGVHRHPRSSSKLCWKGDLPSRRFSRCCRAKYGHRSDANCRRYPRTDAVSKRIPGLTAAFLSILSPGKHIPPHRGFYSGVLRYHLGLMVPDDCRSFRISVGGDVHR